MKTIRIADLVGTTEQALVELVAVLDDPATEYPLVIDDRENPLVDIPLMTVESKKELEEYVEGFAEGAHALSGEGAS